MANHSLPTQTSGYINFVQELDSRFDDLARGLDPAKSPVGDPNITNLPVDSIGWSSQTGNWRKWNGSTWEALIASNLYSINISGNAVTVTDGVYLSSTQTITGTKTFSSTIVGSVSGNAGTVTNGVYNTGNQTIAGIKTFSSTIVGSVSGNAGTVTGGVYTSGDQTIAGIKTFSSTIVGSISGSSTSCSGNAASATTSSQVTINYGNDSNSTYQMLWGSANTVYGTLGIYCNPSTDYLYATSFNCSNWFRSTGNTGWYNESYAVGIYSIQSGQVRTMNGSSFYSEGSLGSAGDITSSGDITASGSLTANSDENLKTNWRDLPSDYIEKLANIKHGIYDRTDYTATQVGVSAQSLQGLLPDSIIANSEGILSVAYGNAAMVSAIKLAERVVEQDTLLKIQESRISKLEQLISQLIKK